MKNFIVTVQLHSGRREILVSSDSAKNAAILATKDPINASGVVVEIRESASKDQAQNAPKSILKTPIFQKKSVDEAAHIAFIKQLAVMCGAGIPLASAIKECAAGLPAGTLKTTYEGILASVAAGAELGEAVRERREILGQITAAMFALGSKTGRIDSALVRLAETMAQNRANRQKLVRALRYPAIILVAIMAAFGVMMGLVIPTFKELFASFGGELPLATRALIGVGDFINEWWIWGILGAALAVISERLVFQKSAAYRITKGKMACRIWLINRLIRTSNTERFILVLGELMSAGLPLKEAFETALDGVQNEYLKGRFSTIFQNIERGQSLQKSFASAGELDRISISLIAAGEASGEISVMLERVAAHYKEQLDSTIEALGAYLEPVLMLVVGAMVLVMALAIFMPMWGLAGSLG